MRESDSCNHDPKHKQLCYRLISRHKQSHPTRSLFLCYHRCPEDNPTWCICKWATAQWINGYGQCDDSIEFDCDATDICATINGLFFTYNDYSVNLAPAHDCISTKCSDQWTACCNANPSRQGCASSGQGKDRLLSVKIANIYIHGRSARV